MSTEFEKLKAYKIAILKNNYNTNLQNLTNKYKNDLSILSRSPMPLRTKNFATQILRINYNNNVNNLRKKLYNDINAVEKMTIDKIILKNKNTALLLGINYNGTNYQLNGCINDAESIKNRCNMVGFKNTVLLTDNTSVKPTKENIINELKNLLNNSSAGDLLVFSFSGHGSYTLDTNGDEMDARDEMIVSIDFKPILDDEIRNIIQNNLKKDVTLFALFDSCHSGTVLDLKYQYYDSSNYDEFTMNENVIETTGDVIMISGCADSQTSMDSYLNKKWQGAMTWSFLESLNELENPTWRELIKKMRDKLKDKNYEQIPQLSSGKFFDIDTKVFV